MPHSIHNPLAFRPAPGSLAGPLAGGAFLMVVALGVMGIPLLVANDRPVEPGLIGVVACLALFLGGLAGSLFYLAYRLRNSLVLLGDEGLVVRADQGRLRGFRRLVEARLAWSDVLGITARGFSIASLPAATKPSINCTRRKARSISATTGGPTPRASSRSSANDRDASWAICPGDEPGTGPRGAILPSGLVKRRERH